jgi:hypothetical protein
MNEHRQSYHGHHARFLFLFSLSVLLQTTATTIVALYRHYLNSVTGTRTHIFSFSIIFSLVIVSLYLPLLVCAELAMYAYIYMCVYVCVIMAERNLCMIVHVHVVLLLIQFILPFIPVFLLNR